MPKYEQSNNRITWKESKPGIHTRTILDDERNGGTKFLTQVWNDGQKVTTRIKNPKYEYQHRNGYWDAWEPVDRKYAEMTPKLKALFAYLDLITLGGVVRLPSGTEWRKVEI